MGVHQNYAEFYNVVKTLKDDDPSLPKNVWWVSPIWLEDYSCCDLNAIF